MGLDGRPGLEGFPAALLSILRLHSQSLHPCLSLRATLVYALVVLPAFPGSLPTTFHSSFL